MRDDGILDVASLNLRRGQETRGGVDGRFGVVELKVRRVLGQVQVGLEEALDGSNVLPVIVEQVRLHLGAVLRGLRDDFATEIIVLRVILIQELHEHLLLKDVDTHRRNERLRLGFTRRQPQHRGVHLHALQLVALWLFRKFSNAPSGVNLHQPKITRTIFLHGQSADGNVCIAFSVRFDKLHVIHAVQVITRKNHHVFDILVLHVVEQPAILTHGVGGALEPLLTALTRSLRRGEYLDETITTIHDTVTKVVRARQVTVQRRRVELSQNVDLGNPRV